MIWGVRHAADPADPALVRPFTRWWVWLLVVFLTAWVVVESIDVLNTPEPGQVKTLEAVD